MVVWNKHLVGMRALSLIKFILLSAVYFNFETAREGKWFLFYFHLHLFSLLYLKFCVILN